MEEAAVAFCPGHISGYFRPVRGDTLRENREYRGRHRHFGRCDGTGGTSPPSHSVEITRVDQQGSVIERLPGSPPVEYLMETLGVTAKVSTRCHLPISAGFGLSAAALTSSAMAANQAFALGYTLAECSWFAHEAEILHKTGLGDVAACQGGGVDCRKGPGIAADIARLPGPFPPVYAVTFGPLPSPGILGDPAVMERVTRAFPGTCPGSIEELLILSRAFAEKSGLITPDVRQALDLCDTAGVLASMTMLGNGIFAIGRKCRTTYYPGFHRFSLSR